MGYDDLNGLQYEWNEIGDTKLGHVNLGEFWGKVNKQPKHPITQKLVESGLIQYVGFLVIVYYIELILGCINRYNPNIR